MAKKTSQQVEPKVVSELDQPIPFDEALRRMVNTPPQHKTAKKTDKPQEK